MTDLKVKAGMNIATIDAAEARSLEATIRLDARGTPLEGQFVVIPADGDAILGEIRAVKMTNPIHADPRFAPFIMKEGSIKNWSSEVDIERAGVRVIAVIDKDGKRIPMRRNPPSGTSIKTIDQATFKRFANEQGDYYANVGYIPNTTLLASVINRDFDSIFDSKENDRGGCGEARHVGIFGQSGSAKTVLVLTLLCGKLAQHPALGLFMLDTSGDLEDPNRHSRGDYRWNYRDVLNAAGINLEVIDVEDIRLTSPRTLEFKFTKFFREQLSMSPEKAAQLSRYVVAEMFEREVDPVALTSDRILTEIINCIPQCYEQKTRQAKVNDATLLMTGSRRAIFDREFGEIKKLFDGRWPLSELLRDILRSSRKCIITMKSVTDRDHRFVMREAMEQLQRLAQRIFFGGQAANALIVLDEAQRWVPEGGADADDEQVRDIIEAGLRETRKLGVGWYIVAQSPAQTSNRVIRQCMTVYFGRNLGLGADEKHLESRLGKQGLELYQTLAIQGGYFWVASGLDANIGSGGMKDYFAFHPFDGNATQAFIWQNEHIFKDYCRQQREQQQAQADAAE